MENIIKNYFVNKKVEKEEPQIFPNLKKLDMCQSRKYRRAVHLLNCRLKVYQEEGKLSYVEAELLGFLINEIREATVEALKVDIYTKMLKGVTDVKSKL